LAVNHLQKPSSGEALNQSYDQIGVVLDFMVPLNTLIDSVFLLFVIPCFLSRIQTHHHVELLVRCHEPHVRGKRHQDCEQEHPEYVESLVIPKAQEKEADEDHVLAQIYDSLV